MTRLSQEDDFRFARGEEVTTTHGLRAKLSRLLEQTKPATADYAVMIDTRDVLAVRSVAGTEGKGR